MPRPDLPAPPPAVGGRPPTAEEEAGLRLEVGALARGGASRRRPVAVHAGPPGGTTHVFVDHRPADLDAGLRRDVVAALLARARPLFPSPVLWTTRAGRPTTEDLDLAWYSAARAAYAETGTLLLMAVVTPHGWYDPGSGQRREWRRLRLDR